MYNMPEKPGNTEMYISSYQDIFLKYCCNYAATLAIVLWHFG